MKWIKDNAGLFTSGLAAVVILIGWLSGAFGFFLEMETRPLVKEVVIEEVLIHELRMEPRLQAIERNVGEQKTISEESLAILKKLDPDAD